VTAVQSAGEAPQVLPVSPATADEPAPPVAAQTAEVNDRSIISGTGSAVAEDAESSADLNSSDSASGESDAMVVEAAEPVVEEQSPPEILPPVDWPRLKLTALLCGVKGEENAAIINGAMVAEGGEIEGAILKEVQQEGVLLQIQHETRFLRMGATIY
jgi:hypothetical protein